MLLDAEAETIKQLINNLLDKSMATKIINT